MKKAAKRKGKPLNKVKGKQIVVAVSGGFDPLHIGHVRLFREAKKLGHKLVVILNNDNWLMKKKGFVFMPEHERKEVLEAIKGVDEVVLSFHSETPQDMSVCAELKNIRPHIFANGGDRTEKNIPEIPVCDKINCRMMFSVGQGGKIQSSSWLLQKHVDKSKPK
ncbi:adenylyltransferase/cytidyltransferase family protein [Candidatus Giovannonibacteria bacterium]|nr:adenylyltransferase/cytidyltransferase family protein [Candidatus Giovannonibacteria bacterium]